MFVGGLVPALVFGVAVGYVLQGAPFRLVSDLRSHYEGTLLGLLSVSMLVLRGAGWLSLKIEEVPALARARRFGGVSALASVILFAIGGVLVATGKIGFRIDGVIDGSGPSNPHYSGRVAAAGAWLDNYGKHPWMVAAPVLGLLGPIIA